MKQSVSSGIRGEDRRTRCRYLNRSRRDLRPAPHYSDGRAARRRELRRNLQVDLPWRYVVHGGGPDQPGTILDEHSHAAERHWWRLAG